MNREGAVAFVLRPQEFVEQRRCAHREPEWLVGDGEVEVDRLAASIRPEGVELPVDYYDRAKERGSRPSRVGRFTSGAAVSSQDAPFPARARIAELATLEVLMGRYGLVDRAVRVVAQETVPGMLRHLAQGQVGDARAAASWLAGAVCTLIAGTESNIGRTA